MKENNYIEVWEQADHVPDNQKLNNDMIAKSLQPKVSKVRTGYFLNLGLYLIAIVASIILLSMDIYIYRHNPLMMGVEIGLLVLSLGFLGYGVYIFMRIREINSFTRDLKELLQNKIRFLKFHYEIWIVCSSIVLYIFVFALNSLMDNQDGTYPINNVAFFIFISCFMLIIVYGAQKLSSGFSQQELRSYLEDLESGYLNQSYRIETKKRKLKIYMVILFVLLGLTTLLGLLKFLGLI